MRYTPKLCCSVFLFLLGLPVLTEQLKAEETKGSVKPASSKDSGQPQMVWLTYTSGDVKLSPGHAGKPQLGKDWLAANTGQVMESGYTLVTEKGRAEIEFEDGTVIYLADHSALEFDSLWSAPRKFQTELSLLTGMVTVAHESNNEVLLYMPTARINFVEPAITRVECAVDGIRIMQIEAALRVGTLQGSTLLTAGSEMAIVNGRAIPLQTERATAIDEQDDWAEMMAPRKTDEETPGNEEWDTWVTARVARRRALIAEGLKESGMKEPTPGLAGMMENGKFFACQPYGTCWQPNPMMTTATPAPTAAHPTQQAPATAGAPIGKPVAATRQGTIILNQTMLMRCPLEAWRLATNAQAYPVGTAVQYGSCFAGSWDYTDASCFRRRQLYPATYDWPDCQVYSNWVVGRRHRHECRMVKAKGHSIGFVPRHPLDKTGHPPLNAKSGILVLSTDKGKLAAGVQLSPAQGPQLETSEPRMVQRGIEKGSLESATRVDQPFIEGRTAEAILPRGVLGPEPTQAQKTVTAIHFDYKRGNFVGRSAADGSEHAVVVSHSGVTGSGGVHAGSVSGGGGSSSGGGGHSSGGGSSGGGVSSGGGGGGSHH